MYKTIRMNLICLSVIVFIICLMIPAAHSAIPNATCTVVKVNNVYPSPDTNTPVLVNANIKVNCAELELLNYGSTLITINFPSGVTLPENQVSIRFTDPQYGFTQDMFEIVSHPNSVDITFSGENLPEGPGDFLIHIDQLIITELGELNVDITYPDPQINGHLLLANVIASSGIDASLSDLQVNGSSIPDFQPSRLNYEVEVPVFSNTIPTVTAITNYSGASVTITPAINLDGTESERTTKVLVNSQDLTITREYTVTFKQAVTEYDIQNVPKVYPSPDAMTPINIGTYIKVRNSFMEVFNNSNMLSIEFPENVIIPDNQVSILLNSSSSGCGLTQEMFTINTNKNSVDITLTGNNLSGPGSFFIYIGNLIVTDIGDLTVQLSAPADSCFASPGVGSKIIAKIMGSNSGTNYLISSVKPLSGQAGNIDIIHIAEVIPDVFKPGTQIDLVLPAGFYFVPQSVDNSKLPIVGQWRLNGSGNVAWSNGTSSPNYTWYSASLLSPQSLRITFLNDYHPSSQSAGAIAIGWNTDTIMTKAAYIRIGRESTAQTPLVYVNISSPNNQEITNKELKIAEFVEINADLADIKIDHLSVPDFDYQKTYYTVNVPLNTTTIPMVTAVGKCADANISVTQASNLDGTKSERSAYIEVTSADQKSTNTYSIEFVRSDIPQPPSESDCFIATAAYGNYLEPHVQILREFRDKVLLHRAAGRWFVREYYQHSPSIAAYIAKNDTMRLFTRLLLTPIVFGIAYPNSSLALVLILIAWCFVMIVRKKCIHN